MKKKKKSKIEKAIDTLAKSNILDFYELPKELGALSIDDMVRNDNQKWYAVGYRMAIEHQKLKLKKYGLP